MADNAVNKATSLLKKPQAAETEPTITMNPKWSYLTPCLQFVAAILSEFFYDDLVGFTLELVNRRVVAVAHNFWDDEAEEWTESRIEFYEESFELLKTIGSLGSGEGQFLLVTGLCFDKSRRILFASDQGNRRIYKFDESGSFLCCFGEEVLKSPRQLSLSPDCSTLAVADYDLNEVFLFAAETGEMLRRSGAIFNNPSGVCHLSSDELLVAHEKQVLLLGAASLKVKGEWKSDEFEWQDPWQIAMDESKGIILIADLGASRAIQFSKSGDYLGSIASHGGEPIKYPKVIAVDAAGILFLSCYDATRVFDEANSKFGDEWEHAFAIIDL